MDIQEIKKLEEEYPVQYEVVGYWKHWKPKGYHDALCPNVVRLSDGLLYAVDYRSHPYSDEMDLREAWPVKDTGGPAFYAIPDDAKKRSVTLREVYRYQAAGIQLFTDEELADERWEHLGTEDWDEWDEKAWEEFGSEKWGDEEWGVLTEVVNYKVEMAF